MFAAIIFTAAVAPSSRQGVLQMLGSRSRLRARVGAMCPQTDSCADCARVVGCGWCTRGPGAGGGICTSGNILGPSLSVQCACWDFDQCTGARHEECLRDRSVRTSMRDAALAHEVRRVDRVARAKGSGDRIAHQLVGQLSSVSGIASRAAANLVECLDAATSLEITTASLDENAARAATVASAAAAVDRRTAAAATAARLTHEREPDDPVLKRDVAITAKAAKIARAAATRAAKAHSVLQRGADAKRRAARRKRQECTAKRHLSADMRVAKMAAGIESKLRKQIAASRAEELRVAQSVLAHAATSSASHDCGSGGPCAGRENAAHFPAGSAVRGYRGGEAAELDAMRLEKRAVMLREALALRRKGRQVREESDDDPVTE